MVRALEAKKSTKSSWGEVLVDPLQELLNKFLHDNGVN